MFKEIKWFYQRVTRGYSDRDLWCPYEYLGGIIIKTLTAYKNLKKTGHPANLNSVEEWDAILDKMVDGFIGLLDLDDNSGLIEEYLQVKNDVVLLDEWVKKIEKKETEDEDNAKLFIEYFKSLWN